MRILHVVHGIGRELGGVTTAVEGLVGLERRIGCDSSILALQRPGRGGESSDLPAQVHLHPYSFPARFSNSNSALGWLDQSIRGFDLTVLHSTWFILIHRTARVCSQKGTPFVLWSHGSLDPFDLRKKSLAKKILGPLIVRGTLERSGGVMCASQEEADRLETYGAAVERWVVPLPVEAPEGGGDRSRFRAKYALGPNQPVFLFMGRIDYKKGLNLVLPALKQLRDAGSNARLIIAGSSMGGYGDRVRAWVDELDLASAVTFAGFLSGGDKLDAMAGCDCFVLPSMNENFGIAIVECLRAGLPVLTSDNVYIWRDIVPMGAGWLCQYSVDSVRRAMEAVVSEVCEGISRASEARLAGAQFDPQAIATRYHEVLDRLVVGTSSA